MQSVSDALVLCACLTRFGRRGKAAWCGQEDTRGTRAAFRARGRQFAFRHRSQPCERPALLSHIFVRRHRLPASGPKPAADRSVANCEKLYHRQPGCERQAVGCRTVALAGGADALPDAGAPSRGAAPTTTRRGPRRSRLDRNVRGGFLAFVALAFHTRACPAGRGAFSIWEAPHGSPCGCGHCCVPERGCFRRAPGRLKPPSPSLRVARPGRPALLRFPRIRP